MGAGGSWDRFKEWLFDDPELGLRLDVSRMDMPGDYVERMQVPVRAALEAMTRLESGEIANPDEQRRVGHYWLRAPELAPDEATARAIREACERVRGFAARVHEGAIRPERTERFEAFLLIGIGGSALGPQFVADALGGPGDRLTPRFLDNTDPDGIERTLAEIDPERTLVVVVSKSGGTPETRNGMLAAAERYRKAGLRFGRHAVAVTQSGSRLDRYSEEQEFVERFPMWDWVGGRTSELSAVGLVPAALQGLDIDGLLQGAALIDRVTRARDPRRNPAVLLALAWYHAGDGRGRKDMVVLPYRDRLALFSRYLQQLVMESLGKALDLDGNVVHQGISVYGNKGSTDQHAYVQQLRDGLANFFVTFIHVLRDAEPSAPEVEDGITAGDYLNGFLLGTRRALHENGRPSLTIAVRELNARSVGMLIGLYERAVGLYATMIRVNAYHQPGVEAGKKAAAAVLDLQRRLVAELERRGGEAADCAELAASVGAGDDIETAFHVLEHLAANHAHGIHRTLAASAADTTYHLRP